MAQPSDADPRIAGGWSPNYAPAMVPGALSPEICSKTIAVAKELGFAASPVYNEYGVGSIDDPDHRRSESVWIRPEQFQELYKLIIDVFHKVNNDNFRFTISGMVPIQIIRYGAGCFFSEHFDFGVGDAARRKISMVVQLSDAADYEGGELVLAGRLTASRELGTACVFPSWYMHRVDEVKSGMRYSLAAWAQGTFFL